ncbi:hypothetical protein BJ684DRAFT_20948 [Piptocephalis cylindrospora]|uniref:REJ domain-containing protein n=1 Tax=Piptocephalis cylindrospora TaxID=1907219 RepID=A0A4P9Y190_9FUNG|nr:hypothetical protein BJ684DRAFT_20948 [Piptocephalis cylindrospora]|eukprot:RKP12523.1 hypothetical protein BJ684DRAFT_20948 [Piptocephalis cylindrospora]
MRLSTHQLTLPYVLLYLILQFTVVSSAPIPAGHTPAASSSASPASSQSGSSSSNTAPVAHTPPGPPRSPSPTPTTSSTIAPSAPSASLPSPTSSVAQPSASSLPDSSASDKPASRSIHAQAGNDKVQGAKAKGDLSSDDYEKFGWRPSPASSILPPSLSSLTATLFLFSGLSLVL